MALCSKCKKNEAVAAGMCNACGEKAVKEAGKKIGREKIRPKGNGKKP